MSTSSPPHFRIHSVVIFVANMDRSLRFYVDQLGFDLVADTQIPIGRWVAVAPSDGTTLLVLVSPEPDSQEFKLIGRSRNVVLVSEDVVANFQEWSKRGVQFRRPPRTQTWGGMDTNFEDPDGNSLSLVATMPRPVNSKVNAAQHKNWKLPNRFRPSFSLRCCHIFERSITRAFACRLIKSGETTMTFSI